MRRTYFVLGSFAALCAAGIIVWQTTATTAAPKVVARTGENSTRTVLPLTHVILFSSGVGYFQREGIVDGDVRIDMTFRVSDVNDLLKSLVLQDLDGGRISAVSYDSQEPVEKTLKSFALDLTYNPTVGQLLNQARGEKLEVTLQQAAGGQPAVMTGIILGMEAKQTPHGKDHVIESDLLNLLCTEGVRTVKLADVQRLRFLNAALDAELRLALGVRATSHDSQKKVISLNFKGEGKRRVKVGYVIENPIWKASYRLVLNKAKKNVLQGWALVENTSDEDWKDAKVALVSGRPISFQMDLYQPLFIPRPTVEPYEILRFGAGGSNRNLKRLLDVMLEPQAEFKEVDDPAITLSQLLQTLSTRFSRPGANPPFYLTFEVNQAAFEAEGQNEPLNIAIAEKKIPALRNTSLASYLRRILEKVLVPSGATFVIRKEDDRPLLITSFDERDRALIRTTLDERNRPPAHYVVEITTGQFFLKGMGIELGEEGLDRALPLRMTIERRVNPLFNRYQPSPFGPVRQGQVAMDPGMPSIDNPHPNVAALFQNRLTFEQYQRRRKERLETLSKTKGIGNSLAALDPSGVSSVASGAEVGDYFQYFIDEKITLPRQKSAMLPIVNKDVEAKRVSIYNESVHAKFPLLGLRFKNTTDQNLMQGPVTIYEDGSYAGDARLMDLQPNEERLLSYAIDLGSEVKTSDKGSPERLIAVKVTKGIVQATHKLRETKTYTIVNRSKHDRAMIVEHPVRNDWKLVEPARANEQSRDVYRFEVKVPAGKTVAHTVIEEQMRQTRTALSSADERLVRIFVSSNAVTPKVKDALRKAVELRTRQATTKRELAHVEKQLKAINDDQTRLRANLDKVPPTSAAYKRYLEKFDKQETQIEKHQASIQEKQEEEKKQQQEYEDYLTNLNIE